MRRRLPPNTSVDDLEQTFYEALQRADLDALMACWADEDEPVCVHPGGPRLVGAMAIRESFARLFETGAVRAVPTNVRQTVVGQCCVHSLVERVEVPAHDGVTHAYVTATNVYVKTAQGWRLLVHHASPGALSAPLDQSAATATLH